MKLVFRFSLDCLNLHNLNVAAGEQSLNKKAKADTYKKIQKNKNLCNLLNMINNFGHRRQNRNRVKSPWGRHFLKAALL